MNIDWSVLGTGIAVVALVYQFLRNFKADINSKLDGMEKRIDQLDARMFWLATGKKLEDVLLEERREK